MGGDSYGMLLSAGREVGGEERLHLLTLDDAIPAGAKLYWSEAGVAPAAGVAPEAGAAPAAGVAPEAGAAPAAGVAPASTVSRA